MSSTERIGYIIYRQFEGMKWPDTWYSGHRDSTQEDLPSEWTNLAMVTTERKNAFVFDTYEAAQKIFIADFKSIGEIQKINIP